MTPTPPPPPLPLPEVEYPERNTFARGFGFILLMHLALFPVIAIVGVTQLIYVIPTAIRAHNRRHTARLQGVLVAAGLTFLLNGLCFVAVFTNFNPR